MLESLSVGLLWLLLAHSQESAKVKIEPTSVEGKVATAVYRYQIKQCYPEIKDKVYFLGFYDGEVKELPEPFMAQFKDHQPPLKKYSGILRSGGDSNRFTDKESGKQAVLLTVAKINMLGDTKAEVEGSCGAAEWAAKGYQYSVELEGNQWVVRDSKPTWVF